MFLNVVLEACTHGVRDVRIAANGWAAVAELRLSYYTKAALLFVILPYDGNLA